MARRSWSALRGAGVVAALLIAVAFLLGASSTLDGHILLAFVLVWFVALPLSYRLVSTWRAGGSR